MPGRPSSQLAAGARPSPERIRCGGRAVREWTPAKHPNSTIYIYIYIYREREIERERERERNQYIEVYRQLY